MLWSRFHVLVCQLLGTAAGLLLHTTPACFKIECGPLNCLPPLEIKNDPGLCCPICWGPVTLDPQYVHWDNLYLRKAHTQAPGNCQGVKCFALHCIEGQVPGYKPNGCCSTCVPVGSVHASVEHAKIEDTHAKLTSETATKTKGGPCSEKCSAAFTHNCYPHYLKSTPDGDPYQFCRDGINGANPELYPHIAQDCKGEEGCSDTPEMAALMHKKEPTVEDHVEENHFVLGVEPGMGCGDPDSAVTAEEDCQFAAEELGMKYKGLVYYKSASGCFYDSETPAVYYNAAESTGPVRSIDTGVCYGNEMLLD